MTHYTKAITLSILVVLLLVAVLPISAVMAEVVATTDVLVDLQKDSNFDVSKYPLMTYDYFNQLNTDDDSTNDVEYLSVLHIAESANKELFVYTYQPLNNLSDITATSINIATAESAVLDMAIAQNSTDFAKYDLKCVSFNGPFKKYLVENFVVSEDFYRYYCISEIERPFDTLLDEKIGDKTITDFKAHNIGQAWCCYYSDDKLIYEMCTLDVVELTPTFTGSLYYPDGITWGSLVGVDSGCLSHFIAFNIENYDVQKIMNASLVYKTRDYRMTHTVESGLAPSIMSIFGYETDKTTIVYPNGETYTPIELDISDTDVATNNGKGLLAKQYSWNRIMTAEAFIDKFESEDGEFSESAKVALENSQFVFAFAETTVSYSQSSTQGGSEMFPTTTWVSVIAGTEVAKIDVLRLKFLTPQGTFDLGVVSDTTSEDIVPDGTAPDLDLSDAVREALVRFMTVLFGIIAIVLFALVVVSFLKYILLNK